MVIKSFLKNLFLTVVSIAFILLFLEGIFRLVPYLRQNYAFERFVIQDPQEYWKPYIYRPSRFLGYERIPNCVEEINSFGLVGAGFNVKKDSGVYRILVLGDSIVEQNHFIEYLKEKLNSSSYGVVFEFINGGVAGYDIWQNANFLKYKGLNFEPDMVLVSLCLGAFSPEKMVCYKTEESLVEMETVFPKRLQDIRFFNLDLFSKSYLYRLLISGVEKILGSDRDFSRKDEGIEKVGEIEEICQSDQIPCFGFIWPYLMPQNEYDEDMRYQYSSMLETLDYLGFSYIDLHEYFPKDSSIKAMRIETNDYVHPSEEGHKIAAEVIFKYLMDNGYFDELRIL